MVAQAQLGARALFDEALARTRRRCRPTSPLRAEAQVVEGSALERLSRAGEAADAVCALPSRPIPTSWRARAEVRVQVCDRARCRRAAAQGSTRRQKVWREVYIESPISYGARAAPRLDPLKPLNAVELVRRAKVLFDAMKNKESEQAWQQVLATPGPSIRRTRVSRALSGRDERDGASADRAARGATVRGRRSAPAKQATTSTRSRVVALHGRPRSYGSRAEKDRVAGARAIALYQQLMKEAPAHSYADDAALREADVYDTLGDKENATAVLSSFPQRFPKGDQLGEALFRLAFRAFETGDVVHAMAGSRKELTLLPREEGWWEAGRTLYSTGSHVELRPNAALGQGRSQRRAASSPAISTSAR